jgi:hypothetical protein
MGVFDGLLGGFLGRKADVEERNYKEGVAASQREGQIFSALMGSDDPELRSLALTGLLDTANPRRKAKGLAGWIGETQASPYLQQIRTLMATPVTEPNPAVGDLPSGAPKTGATLPSRQTAAGVAMPSVQPSITEPPDLTGAAGSVPTTSPVAPGGSPSTTTPPPTPRTYTQAPSQPYTVTHPRQAFMGPMERFQAEAVAKAGADVEGDVTAYMRLGLSRTQAIEQVRAERLRKGSGATEFQALPGEVPDGQGGWRAVTGVFDRTTGQILDQMTRQPLVGFRGRTTAPSASMGVAIEPLARVMFGKRGVDLSQQEMAAVYEASVLQKSALTAPQALQAVERLIPNATVDQKLQLADALRSGTAAPVAPATAGGPPAPSTAAPAATPPATPSAPAATPPGAAGATTPPPAPTKPAGLQGAVPPGFGAATKETGKPPSPAIQQAVARTEQMNDVITKALAALEPYKQSTNLNDTMNLVAKYRAGTEGDPFELAAAQLPDLAGLQQSAAATLGGTSRSQRVYADKRQHVPRLPSGRQIMLAHNVPGLNAGRVNSLSQLYEGDEGGFDSPAQMYQKLVGLRDANQAFLKDITSAAQMQLNPIGNGGPPTPAGVTPGQPYFDKASNSWIIP